VAPDDTPVTALSPYLDATVAAEVAVAYDAREQARLTAAEVAAEEHAAVVARWEAERAVITAEEAAVPAALQSEDLAARYARRRGQVEGRLAELTKEGTQIATRLSLAQSRAEMTPLAALHHQRGEARRQWRAAEQEVARCQAALDACRKPQAEAREMKYNALLREGLARFKDEPIAGKKKGTQPQATARFQAERWAEEQMPNEQPVDDAAESAALTAAHQQVKAAQAAYQAAEARFDDDHDLWRRVRCGLNPPVPARYCCVCSLVCDDEPHAADEDFTQLTHPPACSEHDVLVFELLNVKGRLRPACEEPKYQAIETLPDGYHRCLTCSVEPALFTLGRTVYHYSRPELPRDLYRCGWCGRLFVPLGWRAEPLPVDEDEDEAAEPGRRRPSTCTTGKRASPARWPTTSRAPGSPAGRRSGGARRLTSGWRRRWPR
jgi:hypothetical protein